jgi:hypothetical protein
VLIAEFPYGNETHPDVSDWITETIIKMRDDPRIGAGNVFRKRWADTPITMTRNACLVTAEKHDIDYVLMVDSDMRPDLNYEGSKPFWDTSWDWMMTHRDTPGAIAAPYCGPPPFENVYVFKWNNFQSDTPEVNFKLDQYTRAEAAAMKGIHEAAALPTGVFLIDMRAAAAMKHPRFYYEFTDEAQTAKASTEDVTFTRDMTLAGFKCWCNWDAWAGHHKLKCVGKPDYMGLKTVSRYMIEAVEAGRIKDGVPVPLVSASATDSPPVLDDDPFEEMRRRRNSTLVTQS